MKHTSNNSTFIHGAELLGNGPNAVGPSVADNLSLAQSMPSAMQSVLPAANTSNHVVQKVLIVDNRIPDYQSIVDAAETGVKIVVLDSNQDGVKQIAAALKGMHNVDSISIVAHGDQGLLLLGNAPLFAGNLDHYSSELQAIGKTLRPNGDILLYGCDVGAGVKGVAFLDGLAAATKADVAASSDGIGSSTLGGDWDLEITTGKINNSAAMNVVKLEHYDHLLITSSVSTVTELKAAINTGKADNVDDVITMIGDISFASASDTVGIDVTDSHKMTIVGGGHTLDAAYFSRALNITAGTVELQNLTITHGMVSGNGGDGSAVDNVGVNGGNAFGGAIRNTATLTLNSVTLTENGAAGGGGGGGGGNTTTARTGTSSSARADHPLFLSAQSLSNANTTFTGGGGGGGGSGMNGVGGGNGGSTGSATGTYAGQAGSGGTGGNGGGYLEFGTIYLGGFGGSGSGGGTRSYDTSGDHFYGGAGATATAGSLTIGGGGGGSGGLRTVGAVANLNGSSNGGTGGAAAGAIYNSGTLTIIGTSPITNNLAAGGGGGAGGVDGDHGGVGGLGVGAIWNEGGTVGITAANYAAMTGNSAASGSIGTGNVGGYVSPSAVSKIYNNSGTVNTSLTGFTAPVLTNLNADSMPWISNTVVTLDSGTAATGSDADFEALNSGNGNWNGATITVTRILANGTADAVTKDLYSFVASSVFDLQAGNEFSDYISQSIVNANAAHQNAVGALNDSANTGWYARWLYTYSSATLAIQFGPAGSGDGDYNQTATTALVQEALQHIGYATATPYGNAIFRYTLSDGSLTTTADVTVTSSTITLDQTNDDAGGDAADGFSLREAFARGVAQAGADTITGVLTTSSTITLGSGVTAGAGDTLNLDSANKVTVTGSTVTLGGALTVYNVGSDSATMASVLDGSGSLVKTGSGTLTLSGADAYSGATTVSAGTLAVTGTLSNSAVTVGSSGTLVGTGILSQVLTVNGNLSPGTVGTAGKMTLGDGLTAASTANFKMDLNGTTAGSGYDQLAVTGSVTLSNPALALTVGYTPAFGDSYTLITNDGSDAVSGTFSGMAEGATMRSGSQLYQVSYIGGTGNDVTLTAVKPTITDSTYDFSTGTLVVTGTNFTAKSGLANDITATLFTFTGQGGGTRTLADSPSVEISSSTSFTISLGSNDKAAVNSLLNQDGTKSTGNTTYNLAAADDFVAVLTNGDSSDAINGITVGNSNHLPVITSNGGSGTAAVSVLENSTAVTTVTATDADSDTRSYAITGGSDANKFSLNASTGTLTFVSAPNHEAPGDGDTNNSYVVDVTASDGKGGTDVQTLTVTVTDVNEAPSMNSGATANVAENAAITTVVYSAAASDPDAGATLSYSLGGKDSAALSINAASGAVTLNAAANFEVKPSYAFVVSVTDNSGLTDSRSVTLAVTDVNEAPQISSAATAAVAENAAVDTVVYTALATDVDAGATLTYSLSGADAGLLAINAANGHVTLNSPANFELKSSYNFKVTATDNGLLSDTQAVALTVTNVNEAPTISSGATVSVNENTPVGTVIYTAAATDADAGTTLSYSLSGSDAAAFTINTASGAVKLNAAADFETKPSYHFNVVATDNGSTPLSGSKAITLSVINIDEPPTISSAATASVAENAPIDTVIYTVTAADVDVGTLLSYSLSGTDAGLFAINADSGAVTLKSPADFEAKSSYSFKVAATEIGDGSLSAVKSVTLSVDNVNEAPTINSAATASIAENSAASSVVYTAMAADVDADTTFSYSLSGADSSLLSIDSASGAVTLNASADFEQRASYSFNVIATDNGLLSATQAITLAVTDINEAPTISSGESAAIDDQAPSGKEVYTTVAADVDADSVLTYSLGGADADLLSINAHSGVVTLSSPADSAIKPDYRFNVIVTDPGGLSDTQAVIASVTTTLVNTAPLITSDSGGATATLSIPENRTDVTTVTAADPDAADSLSFSINGGADQAAFAINADTGALRFIQAPNFEAPNDAGQDNGYQVMVQADDGHGGSASQLLTVNITDVQEDSTSPAPTLRLSAGSDTGSSDTDKVINNPLIGVTGVAEIGATVTIQDASGHALGTANTNADGVWQLTGINLAALANNAGETGLGGSYTLIAQAVDSIGNPSPVTPLTVLLDLTPPATPLSLSLDSASDSSPVGDHKTSILNPDFIVQLARETSVGDRLTLLADLDGNGSYETGVGSTIVLTAAQLAGGTASIAVDARSFPDNRAIVFHAVLIDPAGNSSVGSTANDTTTASFITDFDGITPNTENSGSAGGDFNGDGLPDSEQTDVATAPMTNANDFNNAANGNAGELSQGYGALIGGDDNSDGIPDNAGSIKLGNISVTPPGNTDGGRMLQNLANQGLGASTDLINFTATADANHDQQTDSGGFIDADTGRPGIQVRFTIELGGTGVSASKVIKVRPDGSSFDFTATSGDVDGGQLIDSNGDGRADRIVLTITDNGIGDFDSEVGVINDPVFLVAPNSAPVITSNGGQASATLTVPEQTTTVTTVTAVDAELDPIRYTISGGLDSDKFIIDASTGLLAFATAPSFGNPTDTNSDNRYEVNISAGDGKGGIAEQSLAVSVAHVNAAPVGKPAITGLVRQGQTLTADTSGLSDSDGLGSFSYIWKTGSTEISGADQRTYTLTKAEVGTAITVEVSYTDAQGSHESVASAATAVVANANNAPIAVDDSAIAVEAGGGNLGSNPTGNVLTNDIEVDNGGKTVSALSGGIVGKATAGSYGSLLLNSDGSYGYTVNNSNAAVQALNEGASLTELFTYTVSGQDGLSDTATLTITIQGSTDSTPINAISGLAEQYNYAEGHPKPVYPWTALIVDDSHGGQLSKATVSLDGFRYGDWLAIDTSGTTLKAYYNKNAGILTLSGNADQSTYQNVLHTFKYFGTEDVVDAETRSVKLTVTDVHGHQSSGQTLLNIRPSIIIGTAQEDKLTGTYANDEILGGYANDRIDGRNGADLIKGSRGNDLLNGGSGNDYLHGNSGDDTLQGGAGNDWIGGGFGSDTLTGGVGADHFMINTATHPGNIDLITDFRFGEDMIELSARVFSAYTGQQGHTIGLSAYISYRAETGVLSYDADGTGEQPGVAIAIIGLTEHPAELGDSLMLGV